MFNLLPKKAVVGWMSAKSTPAFRRLSSVKARDTDMWYVRVPAGRDVTVVVQSQGHNDFAMDVVDAATGAPLGSDNDRSRFRVTRFRAVRSSYIDIRIANRGPQPTGYELSVTC